MTNFKIDDVVYVIADTIYLNNNKKVPESLLNTKLYIRDIQGNKCTIAREKTGPVLGEVLINNLRSEQENIAAIDPFIIQIPTSNFPVYHSPSKNSGVIKRLNHFALITIIDEKNGFGKIKMGPGWIELEKVNKIV